MQEYIERRFCWRDWTFLNFPKLRREGEIKSHQRRLEETGTEFPMSNSSCAICNNSNAMSKAVYINRAGETAKFSRLYFASRFQALLWSFRKCGGRMGAVPGTRFPTCKKIFHYKQSGQEAAEGSPRKQRKNTNYRSLR